MKLTIPEKLILLAYDPKKGRPMVPKTNLQHALAGAIMFELTHREKIGIKKEFLLVRDMDPVKEEWLDEYLEMLKDATEDRKVSWWIKKFATKTGSTRNDLLEVLIDKGVLRKEKNRILGLIPVHTYPVADIESRKSMLANIRKAILTEKSFDDELMMLISLIGACKLTRKIFRHRKDYNTAKEVVNEVMNGNKISQAVNDSIKAMQAAVVTAVTASGAGTTAAVSGNSN